MYMITSVFESNRLYIRISRVAFEIFQGLFQILRYFRGNIRSKFSGFQKYQGLLARLLWEIFIKYARLSKISRVFRDIITLVFFRDVNGCLLKISNEEVFFYTKNVSLISPISPPKFLHRNRMIIASDLRFADQTIISASLDSHVSKDKGISSYFNTIH